MHDLLNALETITNLEEATLLDLESTSEKKDLELLRPNRTLNPDRADESSLSTELGTSPRRAHGSGRAVHAVAVEPQSLVDDVVAEHADDGDARTDRADEQ